MNDLRALAAEVLDAMRAADATLATAESCTGGLIAAVLTDIAGSSDVLDRGYVTYSNDAKADMLGVPETLIASHGAVSEEVARAMANGALERSGAAIAVAVTGIAGPGGGSKKKPVGTVHFALAQRGLETVHRHERFADDTRAGVRTRCVETALMMILQAARSNTTL